MTGAAGAQPPCHTWLPYAAEHINAIGEYLHGEHTPESQAWLSERLHHLKQEGPDNLLMEIQNLQSQYPQAEVISGNLAYLEKRKEQMQSPQFQAQGWPIGYPEVLQIPN